MDIGNLSPVTSVWPVSATTREGDAGTAMTTTGRPAAETTRHDAGDGVGTAAALPATAAPIAAPLAPATSLGSAQAHQPDLNTPTGPPPTFTTTPLELDAYLQNLLARLNAEGYAQVQALSAADPGASAGLSAAQASATRQPHAVAPGVGTEAKGAGSGPAWGPDSAEAARATAAPDLAAHAPIPAPHSTTSPDVAPGAPA